MTVGPDRRDHLLTYEIVKPVDQRGAVPWVAVAPDHRVPGNAVARVPLDASSLDEVAEDVDDQHPLDLLGVPTRRGEDDHRPPVVAPAHHGHVALDTAGVPAFAQLHDRGVSRIMGTGSAVRRGTANS